MYSKEQLIPHKQVILLTSGNYQEQGFLVKRIELRLYLEKGDRQRGPFSTITAYIETDKGPIELVLEEGYGGYFALEETAAYLTSHPILSGIILRAVLLLKNSLEKQMVVVNS